jgi:hypothetical protein
MGKPSPPKAPDPVAMANAQGAANADTARLQAQLNNVNQYTPYGSVTYQQNGDQWSQYVQPNSQVLQQIDSTLDLQNAALGTATNQLGRVNQALANPLTLNGLPNLEAEAIEPRLQTQFNQGQQIQGQVGPTDFTADRQAVTDSVINQARSRLDPYFNQQEDRLRTQLANQGLSQNSAAYQNASGEFNRGRNDAYNQAIYSGIQQGADEQQALFGQRLAQGQFANQAAAQQYAQNLGQAEFGNAALQQGFANQMANANLTNQARQQALGERAYVQNQPINQLSALMGLSQVQLPQWTQGNTTVAPTDVLGAYGMSQAQKNANYQAKMNNYGGLMGGLFSLGAAAISDRRLKRDVVKLYERDGLNWYAFRYLWSPIMHVGVMAQEVLKVRPDAVLKWGPWLAVDYGRL